MERNTIGLRDDWGEISGILKELEEMEGQFIEKPSSCEYGEDIIKALERGQRPGYQINVIPGGEDSGCHRVLVVAVGSAQQSKYEYADRRILEAIEHVYAKCPQDTKIVIFWAERWDRTAWNDHVGSFKKKGVTVALKLFGHNPKRLA